jgi:signal transduction histidine kinase
LPAGRSRALTVDALAGELAGHDGIPVLVLRLPAIERIAWQQGRGVARRLERRAERAFTLSAARVLRADDLLGHDAASDTFAAALCDSARHGGGSDRPDARAAVARIGAALELALSLDVQSGWTSFEAATDPADMRAMFARALDRGARERERYAFFTLLAHELRTPLASIRGYLETLLDDTIEGDVRRRFTGVAYREALRMSRLIDGLFEISLLDLHAAAPSLSHASLDGVFDAVRDATSSAARLAETTVVFAPHPSVEVAIDADRCVLVLTNLVENAIKHGGRRGIVHVGAASSETLVSIAVDDDGPGVADADRERIFALGSRGRTAAPGTGIGLALVRMLVERAGGRIAVAQAPGGGARFAVTLPRYRTASPAEAPTICGVMKNSTSSLVCER